VEGAKGSLPHPRNRAQTPYFVGGGGEGGKRKSATPKIEPRCSISQVVGVEEGIRESPNPEIELRCSISWVGEVEGTEGNPPPVKSSVSAQFRGWWWWWQREGDHHPRNWAGTLDFTGGRGGGSLPPLKSSQDTRFRGWWHKRDQHPEIEPRHDFAGGGGGGGIS